MQNSVKTSARTNLLIRKPNRNNEPPAEAKLPVRISQTETSGPPALIAMIALSVYPGRVRRGPAGSRSANCPCNQHLPPYNPGSRRDRPSA